MNMPSTDRPTNAENRMPGKYLFLALLLATVVRGGVMLVGWEQLRADPDSYHRLAENLVQHGVYGFENAPTAFRPPLYPCLLAGLKLFGENDLRSIAMMHWLLGVATALLVFLNTRKFRGPRIALFAATIITIDPILLKQSTLVMTETPAAFFAALGLFAVTTTFEKPTPRNAILTGIVLGLACLTRPTFLPWSLLCAASLPWLTAKRNASGKARPLEIPWRPAVFMILGLALTLAPWTVRNQLRFGKPIFATTHGGYTLLLGNNDFFYDYLRQVGPLDGPWSADEFHRWWAAQLEEAALRGKNHPRAELQRNALAYRLARETIERRPGMFLLASGVRMGRLWQCLPYQTASEANVSRKRTLARWAICIWYSTLFAGLLWNMITRTRKTKKENRAKWAVWPLLLIFSVTAIHAFFWANMRMRAPVMIGVALLLAGFFPSRFLPEKKSANHLPEKDLK